MTRDPEALYFFRPIAGCPRTSAKEVMFWSLFGCLFVCLSVCLLSTLRKNFRTDLHALFNEGWQLANEQMIDFCWRYGSPFGCMDCFPDSSRKEVSTDCDAQRCSAVSCTSSIAIATMTSLRHRPSTDSHVSHVK